MFTLAMILNAMAIHLITELHLFKGLELSVMIEGVFSDGEFVIMLISPMIFDAIFLIKDICTDAVGFIYRKSYLQMIACTLVVFVAVVVACCVSARFELGVVFMFVEQVLFSFVSII